MKRNLFIYFLLYFIVFTSYGQFTANNIVALRIGSGTGSLVSTGNPVFLDEYNTSGTLIQSVSLPTTVSGANKRFVLGGTSGSEGGLSLSTDKKYLIAFGYDSSLPAASALSGTTSSAVNRTVARIDFNENIDVTTSLTDAASGSSPRSAFSTNGTDIWVAGGAGGVRYTTLSGTTSTQLSSSPTNIRVVNVFNSQLYFSSATGTFQGVASIGSGTPTTSGQTSTLLTGFPTATGPQPYGFAINPAGTIIYVADDRANASGGIQKWTLSSGTWSLAYTLGTGATNIGARGLTVDWSGASPIIYATTAEGTANRIIKITDTGAGSTSTTLATAATNTIFRGIAFAPENSTPTTTISINDVTVTEGNSGTTNATFTVSLNQPAPVGGVTFDIATANNTATTADNDYVSQSLTAQTITAGNQTYTFTVVVNGDVNIESNETFFVNLSNVVGAAVGDAQGQGTITNDDVILTPINQIQGSGASSPLVSTSVSTSGIVTGLKSNGFFIQEPDATVDADPLTSEGIFVFTSTAPPVAAAIGNKVQVTGTVVEFIPNADPNSPPLSEISSPTVVLISTGNPLPTPITLTTTEPSTTGGYAQLEKYEGMRVSVPSMTVVAPTQGNVNEANATSTTIGVFFGVVTGVSRPYREAGILDPNPAPSGGGSIPPIPRYDGNPELIRVDSDGQTGTIALNVAAGQTLSNVVGPLDFGFRYFTILPDAAAPPTVSGTVSETAVSTKSSTQFTVATYNMQRFFDTVNDPAIGEPVLTTTAFNNRLNKASLAIRNILKTPDIIAVVEMENLTTLETLATKISTDAVANSEPDPAYTSYLVEGNDVGGIDVGFLVKTGITVTEVLQELDGTLLTNPDASTSILNDRPPLRLKAIVNHSSGKTFPITVIVNHLRSLGGVDDEGAGSNGWTTAGARVRAKRQKQAEDLANLIQSIQTANPNEKIMLLGDFNAFQFNDGLVDVIGTILGTPSPDNETAVTGDGADLVTPNFVIPAITDQPYSYTFDGSAQILDHVITSGNLNQFIAKVEHGRINADFPETDRNDANTPRRLSDHDPVVATVNFCPPSNTFIPTAVSVNSTAICSGSSVTLSATCTTGIVTWYNQAIGGTALGTGTGLSASPTSNTTYYAACVDFICISDRVATSAVTINPLPTPSAGSNSPQCVGNTVNLSVGAFTSYAWAGPNSFSSTDQNPSISSVTTVASGSYSVTVTDANGCTATSEVTVTINPLPIPSAGSNSPQCVGNTLNLSVGAYSSYSWSGPNSFSSTDQNPSISSVTTAASGSYSVTVTDANGCTATSEVTVTINPLPTPTVGSNSPQCAGNTLNLTVGAFSSYSWTGPNSFSSTDQNPSINSATTTAGGTYTVTVTDANGCTATSTTVVTINPKPTKPTITPSTVSICAGGSTTLTASACDGGNGLLTWTGGFTGSSITINPADTYSYKVLCRTVFSCESDSSDATVVTVVPIPISPTVSHVVISSGNTATLTATCTSGTPVWYNSSSSQVGMGTFTTPNLTVNTIYQVSCESNPGGSPNCKSTSVEQLVQIDVFAIVTQPNDAIVCSGQNAVFSVGSTGINISYQWQVNDGSGWTNVVDGGVYLGATTANLNLMTPSATLNNYQYRCILTNNVPNGTPASFTTDAKILIVVASGLANNLIITAPFANFNITFQAINTITATNKISGTSRIDYFAGNSIILNPGFSVTSAAGSSFKAKIQTPCTNTNTPIRDTLIIDK